MKPGIHEISMADYIADPCPVPSLSSGCAHRLIARSPYHAWFDHPRLGKAPRDDSKVADIGTVAHDLLLGGEGTFEVIDPKGYPGKTGGIPDGWTNTAIRAARDEARAAGLTPILQSDYARAAVMADRAREFIEGSELAGIFADGRAERSVIWQEGDTWFRTRPDWLAGDQAICLHVKTTKGSAEPDAWIRNQLIPCGYDVAAALYERGLYVAAKLDKTSVFLVIEQDEPHGCSLVALSPLLQEFAERRLNRAISLWERCMASGKWPAYPSRICYADPPAWLEREHEQKEAAGAYDPEAAMQP